MCFTVIVITSNRTLSHTPFFFSQKSNSYGSIALRIKLVDFLRNEIRF